MRCAGTVSGMGSDCKHALQANKSAVIEGKHGRYPAITAEDFVREQLQAIYLKPEA